MSINLATVYRAATPDAAMKSAQPADPVPGLPDSQCIRIPGAGGVVPHHWCLVTAGRYLIRTVARQLDTAHRQAAAQYRILAP